MVSGIKLFLFAIFVLVIVSFLVYFGFYWNDSEEVGEAEKSAGKSGVGEVVKEIEEDEKFEEGEEFKDSESGGSGSGGVRGAGSGGGGGLTGGILAGGCNKLQISYALKDFNEIEICNNFEGNVCIDKSINCSLVVENLDYKAGGNFEIEFSFVKDNGKKLNSFLGEIFLGPRSKDRLEKVLNLQGTDASNDIDCIFITTEVPIKEVCV